MAFVFYEEDRPVGFIISFINDRRNKQENKAVIYIKQIAVLEEYRNKGHATAVLNHVMDKAVNLGMDTARLHIYRNNENAFKLYEKLGFSEIKSIGHWVGMLHAI